MMKTGCIVIVVSNVSIVSINIYIYKKIFGNPNNHFHVRTLGVQYLEQCPEQFIESNTESSWQYYLNNMSCQGPWADAIIIQAVPNCLNLSIHIAESNETFVSITVVQPVNVTRGCTNIYIGHIGEMHYVSTVEKRSSELNDKQGSQISVGDKVVIDKNEKRRAYIKEYMKKRRADAEFRKKENESLRQKRYCNNIEKTREEKRRAAKKRKMANPEHVREIGKQSVKKRKEQNPEQIKEINKKSFRKRKAENPEHIREIQKQTKRKQGAKNPEHTCSKQTNKNATTRKTVANLHATAPPAEMLFQNVQNPSKPQKNEDNVISMIKLFHNNIKCGPEYICTCCDQLWYRSSVVKCDSTSTRHVHKMLSSLVSLV